MSRKFYVFGMTMFGMIAWASFSHAATLIARWEFETAGSLGLDSTANANNGTVNGDVTQVAGKNGQGAFFDGTGDYITKLGLAGGYTAGAGGYTFAAWVKHDPGAAGFDGILTQGVDPSFTFRLMMNSADTLYVNTVGEADRTLTGNVVPDNLWTHVVMTGEQTSGPNRTGKVYLNGVLVNTFTQAATLASVGGTHSTHIGAGDGGTAHQFRGTLDDVRVYQGALTLSEVEALAGIAVPEASSLTLMLFGFIGLWRAGSRRRK
jgi:arabinan endo-1,5-alpha-L-arabinosidase